jgi:predicted GTPase
MTAHQHIQDMIDELPERHQGLVQDIWQSFNDQGQNLTLALVGAFSVGKTSLLNSLLGERWLFTAQEEATALPTLIQYAEKQDIQLIYTNQSSVELDREQFCKVTTIAPDNAKYAMLSLPQDWLKCLKIIDLPGLGSISEKHQAYTIAQIQQADAILYLLAPSWSIIFGY